jgi:hypothetical protein
LDRLMNEVCGQSWEERFGNWFESFSRNMSPFQRRWRKRQWKKILRFQINSEAEKIDDFWERCQEMSIHISMTWIFGRDRLVLTFGSHKWCSIFHNMIFTCFAKESSYLRVSEREMCLHLPIFFWMGTTSTSL